MGITFGWKGMVFNMSPDRALLVRLDSDRFFRAGSRPGPTCGHPSQQTHVEAPTAGSVILAGIPLKLGTYEFLRFSIPMFPKVALSSTPFIYTSSAIAMIYTSSTNLRHIDRKKIIAYSSVAHTNLVTIGMFSPAAGVSSPIFSYGHTQGQNMCAGRSTYQPTSNRGENIACRKTLPSVQKAKDP
ncbi:hypothetical protein M9H77_18935 [Catharanthus roseus]|uniref:Uncharacterized protein n=1 Tax=Catharanthus roseus TaxID=4058 RepID=A0ACC0B8Z7_CATRO|nr:hypothetical protein M9H77_18935 [Catharanthus roseus]